MKKRLAAVVISVLYIAVLVGLLLLQTQTIEGRVSRFTANMAALLLVIPMVLLLKAYIKLKVKEENVVQEEQKVEKPEHMRETFYVLTEQQGQQSAMDWR